MQNLPLHHTLSLPYKHFCFNLQSYHLLQQPHYLKLILSPSQALLLLLRRTADNKQQLLQRPLQTLSFHSFATKTWTHWPKELQRLLKKAKYCDREHSAVGRRKSDREQRQNNRIDYSTCVHIRLIYNSGSQRRKEWLYGSSPHITNLNYSHRARINSKLIWHWLSLVPEQSHRPK